MPGITILIAIIAWVSLALAGYLALLLFRAHQAETDRWAGLVRDLANRLESKDWTSYLQVTNVQAKAEQAQDGLPEERRPRPRPGSIAAMPVDKTAA